MTELPRYNQTDAAVLVARLRAQVVRTDHEREPAPGQLISNNNFEKGDDHAT